jgi:hypothetical protein
VKWGWFSRTTDAADGRGQSPLSEQARGLCGHEAVLQSFFEDLKDEIGEERTSLADVHRALRACFERTPCR